MKTLNRIALIASAALISACATPQKGPNDALEITPDARRIVEAEGSVDVRDPDSEVRCELRRRTGTRIVSRFCYTKTEERFLERQTQTELDRILHRSTCGGGRCGGF